MRMFNWVQPVVENYLIPKFGMGGELGARLPGFN